MSYDQIAIWARVGHTVLVIALLWWLFKRFLAPTVARAQQAKNEEIALAERRRDAAKEQISTAEAEIEQAAKDAQAIRARAEADVRRERELAVAQAWEAGERVIRHADGELERSRLAARAALRIRLIEQALQLARREADAQIDAARNAELVGRFVGSLERSDGRG
jgi:F-type H+-transporting ATPase subunit b